MARKNPGFMKSYRWSYNDIMYLEQIADGVSEEVGEQLGQIDVLRAALKVASQTPARDLYHAMLQMRVEEQQEIMNSKLDRLESIPAGDKMEKRIEAVDYIGTVEQDDLTVLDEARGIYFDKSKAETIYCQHDYCMVVAPKN
jgi:hypothetical protein